MSPPKHEPSPAAASAPRRRRAVNHRRVAELLAQGRSTVEVAEAVGCSRQHVWRLMRRSRVYGRAIAEAQVEVGLETTGKLNGLRPELGEALMREVRAGNVRVMLWLANRLGLGTRSYADEAPRPPPVVPPWPSDLRVELEVARRMRELRGRPQGTDEPEVTDVA